MNLTQIACPYCHSEMIKTIKSYETKHNGTLHLHKCKQCNKVFSETKGSFLERLVKPISFITKVLQSRHEGMGVVVKVRIKNKGSQNRKRGRKRKKYEIPHREYPETKQDIVNNDIHANHVEAFNASQRRKHSAYRRKTNTYAKNKDALQRVLDCEWIVHNFINEHATTKQVPAVSLGILERGLSWEEVFKIQRAA